MCLIVFLRVIFPVPKLSSEGRLALKVGFAFPQREGIKLARRGDNELVANPQVNEIIWNGGGVMKCS